MTMPKPQSMPQSKPRPTAAPAPVPAPPAGPPLRVVRGPRGLPPLGNLLDFGRDPLDFLTRLRDGFGDAVTWSLGPRHGVFLSHPRHIAEVLAAREDTYELLDIGWMFRQLVGRSVILSKGDDWRRKRALVQPVVRPRQVRSYAAGMAECAAAAADGWRDGERIDLRAELALITQRIVLRSLFGSDLGSRARALGRAMDVAERAVGAEFRGASLFLPAWARTPARRRMLAAVGAIDAEVHRLIGERAGRAQPPGEDTDLLGRLLAARDAEGQPLTPVEVRDEAVTLWAAGHDTTSTALTWALYLLAGAPGARARLEAELDEVLGGRAVTVDDYDRLVWTRQVVKEALRLYPPVWLMPAVARAGAALDGRAVRPGTIVWCSQWTVHRDPRWFPEPDRFRPERWSPEAPAAPDHAWFPFGGGPRACLGARFAQVEAVLVLATLAQRCRLDLPAGPVAPRVGLLLQPSVPLTATVHRRR
ncbi:cytochrome P450 [Streptomyces sp. NPDC089919]|uniref:cytochrome P450 n=1 Tax=Streptomyces sp. NPDC089919 TaxID=3155188 RepID=UPI00342D414E